MTQLISNFNQAMDITLALFILCFFLLGVITIQQFFLAKQKQVNSRLSRNAQNREFIVPVVPEPEEIRYMLKKGLPKRYRNRSGQIAEFYLTKNQKHQLVESLSAHMTNLLRTKEEQMTTHV